ncbi:hypothetical protein [Hydrogenophaga sp.]|uniref:hypothetical protein n=1 Tax=Hydrogenophaga sp. TaxID=1904254 RepID=UPI0026061994|nr:hypothetical protein [Hydrogenophaga sp.]MCW5654020.1 hypothetical protein [Hydrogenophaga sp.]
MKEERMWRAGPILGLVILTTLTMTLVGCGGGGDARPSASGLTPQEEIARLEASGEIPVLERSTSLGGIDNNSNGVRDDIERYIERKYAEPAQRKVAMQTARALQKTLQVDTNDAFAVEAVSQDGMRAVNCRGAVFPGVEGFKEAFRMSQELEALTTNTLLRLRAYMAYNKAVSGTVSRLPTGDTCD